jgi:hypothetical protein
VALERGFDPTVSSLILDEYVADAPRASRPQVAREKVIELLEVVRGSRNIREMTAAELGREVGLGSSTIWRILNKEGFRSVKPTFKPGLTENMMKKRLEFALKYTHYTLEDRKNVIFTDETSVVLGRRRCRVRVWRTKDERFEASVIRPKWKGASEFMFWGSFSYEKKGPYHIWKTETAAEQKAAKKDLQTLNDSMEKEAREKWQLATGMRRLVLRHGRTPGRVPEWKFKL